MTSRHHLRLAIPVVALVVALSGCAAPVVPSHSPVPPSSSPRSTAAPRQAVAPSVRVALACGDLFSAATVSSLVDTSVTARADQTTAPTDLEEIAARQRGTLACVWGGTDRTDGGYDEGLTLYVATGGVAGYAANIPTLEADSPPTAENTAGDKSEYECEASTDFQCSANMLVGDYWATAYLQNLGGSTITADVADARIQQVLATLATALRGAKESTAWIPPASTLSAFCSSPGAFAQVESILAASSLQPAAQDQGALDAQTVAQSGQNYADCGWSNPDADGSQTGVFTYVEIGMLRGGAWALPGLQASPPTDWYLGAYKPVTVAGASGALLACNSSDCGAILAVGDNAIQINIDDVGNTARELSTLGAFVAAIKSD